MSKNGRPDTQYSDLLIRIMEDGIEIMPQQEEGARMILGHQMRFDLSDGTIPMVTERDISGPYLKQALGELFAFLNGERTQSGLSKFGCRWWKRWVTEEKCHKRGLETGDLGQGSYGAAWKAFPTSEGAPFDQITHVLEQIKELPHLRTHFVSPWIPQYIGRGEGKTQKVVVAPCHGWFHIVVYPAQGKLSLHHFQRSADVPVGLIFNMVQYAVLTRILAQITGYQASELVYTISDAHIYEQQREAVEEMIKREPRFFPTVKLNESVKDIFAFRQEDVEIKDYNPHPAMTIRTPV